MEIPTQEKTKHFVESALLLQLGNETIQTVVNSTTLSNEVLKQLITQPGNKSDAFSKAIESLIQINRLNETSLQSKIDLLKELSE